jgi:hypothetical protein
MRFSLKARHAGEGEALQREDDKISRKKSINSELHMETPEFIDLPEILSAQGVVRLPGSKSLSKRALLLAALAHGVTEIRGLLEALRALGAPPVERISPARTAP